MHAGPIRTACRRDRQSGGCTSWRRPGMAGWEPEIRRTRERPDRALYDDDYADRENHDRRMSRQTCCRMSSPIRPDTPGSSSLAIGQGNGRGNGIRHEPAQRPYRRRRRNPSPVANARHRHEDGDHSVVAGDLDGEEEVAVAPAREAREEVDGAVAGADLRVVGVMHGRGEAGRVDDDRVDFFPETARWTGEILNREPEKCPDLLWADPRHLRQRGSVRATGDREGSARSLVRVFRAVLDTVSGRSWCCVGLTGTARQWTRRVETLACHVASALNPCVERLRRVAGPPPTVASPRLRYPSMCEHVPDPLSGLFARCDPLQDLPQNLPSAGGRRIASGGSRGRPRRRLQSMDGTEAGPDLPVGGSRLTLARLTSPG